MLNLTGTLEIVRELQNLVMDNASKEKRKTAHHRLLGEQRYDEKFEVLNECRVRELIWFYSGQGPFWSYLGPVGLVPSGNCRL